MNYWFGLLSLALCYILGLLFIIYKFDVVIKIFKINFAINNPWINDGAFL